MNRMDFIDAGIRHFTPDEIIATGARLEDVQLELMFHLESLRRRLDRRVVLLENGLTSGQHSSKWHPAGFACDFTLDPADGPIESRHVFDNMLAAGFRGIGIYWNGKAHSFHGDIRPEYAFWSATKKGGDQGWVYGELIRDPAAS